MKHTENIFRVMLLSLLSHTTESFEKTTHATCENVTRYLTNRTTTFSKAFIASRVASITGFFANHQFRAAFYLTRNTVSWDVERRAHLRRHDSISR